MIKCGCAADDHLIIGSCPWGCIYRASRGFLVIAVNLPFIT
jgi:hypothetical protein